MPRDATIKTNKWAGLTNYNCPFCPHASTQENGKQIIEAHILGAHSTELRQAELDRMTAAVAEDPAGFSDATQPEGGK
jgi:hypothetical protein